MGRFTVVEIDGIQPTASGQLPVVSPPPEPPPGTDPVNVSDRVAEGTVSNAAPAELVFAIPAGKAVTIVQLTGAGETSVGGARVDLLHREGVTDTRVAAPLFLNGTTQQIALMKQFASGSIVLRRTNGSGAPVFVYAEWDGYMEDA